MNEDQYQTLLTEFCNQYHIWDHGYVMDGITNLMYDETLTDTEKVEMVKRIVAAYEHRNRKVLFLDSTLDLRLH